MKTYDAVIIGGGHNGLVAACYLAKAGFDVCVLERYHTIGGAAISEEIEGAPGHYASTGSYVLSLAPQKILNELDVWEHGVELIPRSPHSFTPVGDDSLVYWEDEDAFLKEIAHLSPADAKAYPHYDRMLERASAIMDRYILRQPPSWAEFAAAFDQPGDDLVFKYLILGAVADLAEYFFEHPVMQGNVSSLGLIGTMRGPRDAGTGYVKLYHSMGMATGKRGAWAYVRGAMGSVTQALGRVAQIEGVDIREGVEVANVIVKEGRAVGVATTSGEEVLGKIVLSNADPQRTYLKLVERDALPADYVRDIEAIQITSPVMKINLAVDELPKYAALAKPGRDFAWGQKGGVHIAPSIDYLQAAYEDARNGRPSDYPFFSVHAQSAVDRTLAPEGKHTISIFTQYFPYELAEGTWDARRDAIADHVIKRFAEFAPGFDQHIIARQVLAPPDIEARFGLTGGHIFQGELVPEQAFDMRPVPGSKTYEGPLPGLYLCGAGAWPGGCVMGAPGHNAAHEAIGKLRAGRHG